MFVSPGERVSIENLLYGVVTVSGNDASVVLAECISGTETAFAALDPVGGAEGWGRAVVRDDAQPSGLHRTVQVWLFGMKSRTEYRIEIDGLPIGTILTRPSGSGVLKLQNIGRGHDAVPDDLPPATAVERITVFDLNSAPVLEGMFTNFSQPGGETIFEEE